MKDDRLHVVAAPGSGKTVLGLEVMRRLNKPTVILSPTITIRNQWMERLTKMFLPPGSKKPIWISTDIRKPAFLTTVTYQALFSLSRGEEGLKIVEEIKAPRRRLQRDLFFEILFQRCFGRACSGVQGCSLTIRTSS